MKKLLCILLSVVLIAGTGVISANAAVNPDTHMASITARLRDELDDTSTDTVQIIFYLYDYTSYWDMEVSNLVNEKYNLYEDDKEFVKFCDIEMSGMIMDYNYNFSKKITEGTNYSVHVDKLLFFSQVKLYVVVEAQKDKVTQMAKDYTDVQYMDLFDGNLPSGSALHSQFQSDFEQWTYNNHRDVLEQDPDDLFGYPYYAYSDLYIHNKDGEDFNPDWVLVEAQYNCPEPTVCTYVNLGGAGGRAIFGPSIGSPFFTHYGVYDVEAGEFYGLEQFADNDCSVYDQVERLPFDHTKYDGLLEALEELNIGSLLGDANKDSKVDILDATLIQKIASGKAHMDHDDYFADVNGDRVVDILDAAEIQKYAVIE